MKILYLAPTRIFSGGERITLDIAEEMQRRGHNVAYASLKGEIQKECEKRGVVFIELFAFHLINIQKVIRSWKPDIIHAMDYRASFYGSLLFSNTVGHLHSNCPWISKVCFNTGALLFTLFRAKKVICVSDSIQKECIFGKYLCAKFLTLENTIDVKKIRLQANMKKVPACYEVGMFGRITEEKRPAWFVDIVFQLKRNNPQIKALMVGDGELRRQIIQKIQQLRLEQTITMIGFQENPFPWMKACKVIVMPSEWEGFGLAAVEGMALAKPIVASPVGGLKKIVELGTGVLCDSQKEMVQKIEELLQNPVVYQRYSQRASQEVYRYSNRQEYFDKIEKTYFEK